MSLQGPGPRSSHLCLISCARGAVKYTGISDDDVMRRPHKNPIIYPRCRWQGPLDGPRPNLFGDGIGLWTLRPSFLLWRFGTCSRLKLDRLHLQVLRYPTSNVLHQIRICATHLTPTERIEVVQCLRATGGTMSHRDKIPRVFSRCWRDPH
jgi:hypothetical protein